MPEHLVDGRPVLDLRGSTFDGDVPTVLIDTGVVVDSERHVGMSSGELRQESVGQGAEVDASSSIMAKLTGTSCWPVIVDERHPSDGGRGQQFLHSCSERVLIVPSWMGRSAGMPSLPAARRASSAAYVQVRTDQVHAECRGRSRTLACAGSVNVPARRRGIRCHCFESWTSSPLRWATCCSVNAGTRSLVRRSSKSSSARNS